MAAKWKDQRLKEALQNGTTDLCFDGQAYFASTHDLDPAGNQSNNFTSSALNATNFDTVWAAMASYTGEDGEPMGVMPNLLVVPPQLAKEAREIVAAEFVGGGNSNVLKGVAEVLVVPELADEATTWYLMDTTKGIKPLIFQNRQSPTLTSMTNPNDPNVFSQDQFQWGLKARGVEGYGPWWLAARSIA
jgi:phage major head subunit gpT-like protein